MIKASWPQSAYSHTKDQYGEGTEATRTICKLLGH